MAKRLSRGRHETPDERLDRNLDELLAELRVALPGVQVLFAFLLTVPFTARFDRLTPLQEKLYFAVLLCSALATALFIAPTAGHRLLFRRRQKEYLITVSNRFFNAGLVALALAMCGVIALISDFIFSTVAAVVVTAWAVAIFLGLWYVGPMIRRRRPVEDD